MTGFDLDPSTFPAVASQLDTQRAVLTQQTDLVASSGGGGGNPWGGDQQGSAFGLIFNELLGYVTDVMAGHADLLDYAASELRSWGEDAVATDADVAARLDALGGAL